MSVVRVRQVQTSNQGLVSGHEAFFEGLSDGGFLLANALFEMWFERDQVACPFVEDFIGDPGPKQAFLCERQEDVPNPERKQDVGIEDNHEGVGHKAHALSNS